MRMRMVMRTANNPRDDQRHAPSDHSTHLAELVRLGEVHTLGAVLPKSMRRGRVLLGVVVGMMVRPHRLPTSRPSRGATADRGCGLVLAGPTAGGLAFIVWLWGEEKSRLTFCYPSGDWKKTRRCNYVRYEM